MHKSTVFTIFVLMIIAGLLGWNYFAKPFAKVGDKALVNASPEPAPAPSASTSSQFAQWVATASTRAKIAQVIAYPVVVSNDSATISASAAAGIAELQPGLVTWFGDRVSSRAVESAYQKVTALYGENVPLPLFAVDHEGGRVQRLSGVGFTRLPSWRELCGMSATNSAALVASSAGELQRVHVNAVFGPVLDVASSSSVLGNRSCSNDPVVVAEQGVLMAQVLQAHAILPVFKHFPGIGATTRDLHTSFDRVTVGPTDAALYKTVLSVFPQVGVMIAPVGVTNQYPDIPCSVSSDCVGQVTSNFPEIVIFSDALEMAATAYQPTGESLSLAEVARRSIEAGTDVLVFGPTVKSDQLAGVVDSLVIAYDTNLTVRQKVDQALTRLDAWRTQQTSQQESYEQ